MLMILKKKKEKKKGKTAVKQMLLHYNAVPKPYDFVELKYF